jgi:hypothetical protein
LIGRLSACSCFNTCAFVVLTSVISIRTSGGATDKTVALLARPHHVGYTAEAFIALKSICDFSEDVEGIAWTEFWHTFALKTGSACRAHRQTAPFTNARDGFRSVVVSCKIRTVEYAALFLIKILVGRDVGCSGADEESETQEHGDEAVAFPNQLVYASAKIIEDLLIC